MEVTSKNIDQEVSTIVTEVTTYKQQAEAVVIKTDEDYAKVIDTLGVLTKRKKDMDETRKFFTVPLNDQVDAINAKFMPNIKAVDEIITIFKTKAGAFFTVKEQKRLAEEARLKKIRDDADAKRIASGKQYITEPIRQVAEVQKTTKTESTQSTVSKVWKFELLSSKELPDDIKVLIWNEAVKKGIANVIIGKMVKAGMHEIKGVRIYQDTQISIK